MSAGSGRSAALARRSRETEIALALCLDGGEVKISTGIGFLDHLLAALALHAVWGLELVCSGDLAVDDHHSAEDCALALGEALSRALSGSLPGTAGAAAGAASRGRIRRFGSAYAPLDEALARAVVDLSGRPYCRAELGLAGARLGGLAGENVEHFLASLAMAARFTLHVDVLAGTNAHHRAEAAFKALALALREAAAPDEGGDSSAKGRVLLEELSPAGFAERAAAIESRREGARARGPRGRP